MVSKVYCNSLISFFVVVLGYAFIILGFSLLRWLMTRKLHGTKERKITTPMASYLTENRMKKKKKPLSKGACSIWPPNAFLCLLQPSPLFCSDHTHDSFFLPLSDLLSILPSPSPGTHSARVPSHRPVCGLLPPSLPVCAQRRSTWAPVSDSHSPPLLSTKPGWFVLVAVSDRPPTCIRPGHGCREKPNNNKSNYLQATSQAWQAVSNMISNIPTLTNMQS